MAYESVFIKNAVYFITQIKLVKITIKFVNIYIELIKLNTTFTYL